MHAHVALERIGEIGAERWSGGLVVDKVALFRARQALKIIPRVHIVGAADAGACPRRAPVCIARCAIDLLEQPAKPPPLMLPQARGIERLERGVEHRIRRAA